MVWITHFEDDDVDNKVKKRDYTDEVEYDESSIVRNFRNNMNKYQFYRIYLYVDRLQIHGKDEPYNKYVYNKKIFTFVKERFPFRQLFSIKNSSMNIVINATKGVLGFEKNISNINFEITKMKFSFVSGVLKEKYLRKRERVNWQFRLLKIKKDRGLNNTQLAKKFNVSKFTIASYMRKTKDKGHRKMPENIKVKVGRIYKDIPFPVSSIKRDFLIKTFEVDIL